MKIATEEKNAAKRKFVEVEEDTAKKLRLFCFLRGISIKNFVTGTMEKELKPYENWLENVKEFKPDQKYS